MTGVDPDTQAAEEAARWYARIRADDADDRARAAFRHWRMAGPANARAWSAVSRAEDGLAMVGDDPAIQAMIAAARADRAPAPRRHWQPFAAAAAVALVVGLSATVALQASDDRERIQHVAATDGLRHLRLPDGSTMTLDVGTAVTVRAPAGERRITVDRGRAMFAVAKDAAHPFVVSAGDGSVTALGTNFAVETAASGLTVALVEGSVRVVTPVLARTLVPGDVLTVKDGAARLRRDAADTATGWQRGVLTFDALPLAQVVAALNHHAGPRIILADPALAAHPFSGVLHTRGGAEALASALEAYGTARVAERSSDRIVLKAR